MRRLHLAAALMALMALWACKPTVPAVPNPKPSVYYWRTVFRLGATERDFLQRHQVGKIYLRYFDVVKEQGGVRPNATLQWSQPVPQGIEVIPTVFVMPNCLNNDSLGSKELAQLIVQRVLQMNETNDVAGVQELQVDCDWTPGTQQAYFAMLQEMRSLLGQRGMRLSATIRLHQLALTPPPVDYGALMLYNTGDIANYASANPILDLKSVQPYLRHIAGYELPLCAAYPNFEYRALFGAGKLKELLYDAADLADTTLYRQGDTPGHYLVTGSRSLPASASDNSTHVALGDSLIVITAPWSTVEAVSRAVARERANVNQQVIIYQLDSASIGHFTAQNYATLFGTGR